MAAGIERAPGSLTQIVEPLHPGAQRRQMHLTVELPVRADRSEVWAPTSTVGGVTSCGTMPQPAQGAATVT
jgi:hypothetical protein